MVRQEFNVLALVKGDERYIYVYDDASRDALLEALQEQAADTGLSLNWFDVAVLTQKANEQAAATPEAEEKRRHGSDNLVDRPQWNRLSPSTCVIWVWRKTPPRTRSSRTART